jgi:hypothetical protein
MIRLHSTHWASLSEYGCNTNTRDFGEVAALYSANMTAVYRSVPLPLLASPH